MSDHFNIGSSFRPGSRSGAETSRSTTLSERWPAEPPAAGQARGGPVSGGPVSALYAFADIVGVQPPDRAPAEDEPGRPADLLDVSLAEAGIGPELVEGQDQGDARLLMFPPHTEPARVLAVMPRHLNDELLARNQDMAAHAQMRIRLSFTMGVAVPGGTGLAGAAPIAVVRLGNSDVLRQAMAAAPAAQCGVIIDNYLHGEYVRQGFRADISPDDYLSVRVSNPEKGFDAARLDEALRLLPAADGRAASLAWPQPRVGPTRLGGRGQRADGERRCSGARRRAPNWEFTRYRRPSR